MKDKPTQGSDTPLTENVSNRPEYFEAWELVVPINFARDLERKLNAADIKLTAVLTDKDYEGGVQYWIRKHDELALILARLQAAESGHRAVRDAAAA